MEDEYEEGEVYSAEDAIFDEEVLKELSHSSPSHAPRIQRKQALIELFHNRQQGAQTCYLHFLSKQLIRELMRYLAFRDFFALTGTCRRYNAFLIDPYIDQKFPFVCQSGYLYSTPPSRKDIREALLLTEYRKGLLTQTLSFIRSKHVEVVHVEEVSLSVLVYSLCEGTVSVWKLLDATNSTEEVALLRGVDRPTAFSGYRDLIALSGPGRLVVSSRNSHTPLSFVEGLDSFSIEVPSAGDSVTGIQWLASGGLMLLSRLSSISVVTTSDYQVVAVVEVAPAVRFVHVEDQSTPVAIVYSGEVLAIFNYKRSYTEAIHSFEQRYITTVRTYTYKRGTERYDFLFTLDVAGHLMLNNKRKLGDSQFYDIRLVSKYLLAIEPAKGSISVFNCSKRLPALIKTVNIRPFLGRFIPLQEKLIAVMPSEGRWKLAYINYSGTEYFSLPINVESVFAVRYCPPLILVQALTHSGERCLVVANSAKLVARERLADYNKALEDARVELKATVAVDPLPAEEEPHKRAQFEKHKSKRGKGRVDFE